VFVIRDVFPACCCGNGDTSNSAGNNLSEETGDNDWDFFLAESLVALPVTPGEVSDSRGSLSDTLPTVCKSLARFVIGVAVKESLSPLLLLSSSAQRKLGVSKCCGLTGESKGVKNAFGCWSLWFGVLVAECRVMVEHLGQTQNNNI